MIPPEQNGSFVAHMEMVLDIYKRPYEPRRPVVCMDESPKQLIAEIKTPVPVAPGQPARSDYEYKRCVVCNIFMACEPLAGKRMVKITERKTKRDWATFLKDIANRYQQVKKITLVMDNLNTPYTRGYSMQYFTRKRQRTCWIDSDLYPPLNMEVG